MNKRVLNLIILFAFLFLSATAYSQAVTMTTATGGLAATPQPGGITNIAIFGVQLNKAAGAGNTATSITVAMSTTPVGKFTNARLYESTDATFSGVVTETLVTTGTISATDIAFTGAPLTNFDGLTTADDEFFFVVVDVDPSVTGATLATQPSLASTGVVVTTGLTAGATITGTNYAFAAPVTTIANLPTGLAASPLQAAATNQGVFGFSLTSTGTQTVSAINVQVTGGSPATKWTTASYKLITSTDASLATAGDNSAPIGGLTFTPSATQIGITGLSQVITTGATNYFLIVDVEPGVTGATTNILPSLVAANITTAFGTVAGSASGTDYSFTAPVLTIANLSTGLAASPLIASASSQGVFGFSLTSNGTQTVSAINVQVTGGSPVTKWTTASYQLITSTDASLATAGDNSAPIGGLTFTPSAGQIAITGLSQVITTGTNYFLIVTIEPGVTTATSNIQPSLVAANISTTPGTVAGTATGTDYSFAPLLTIANLSTGLAPSPLIAGTTGQGVFGFSLTSTASQTVTVVNVQVTNGSPATKWTTASYQLITSTDASFATTGDNSAPIGGLTFTPSAGQIAITGLSQVITTGTNYFLVTNIEPTVTGATSAIQPSLGAANVTITTGGGVATGSASGTNYSFSAATATFTEITAGTAPVISGSILSAGSPLQVLTGFSVTSNSTQQITAINFNYSPSTPTAQFATERLYRSTVAGVVGTEVTNDGTADGDFTGLTETINATPVYFYLVVDVNGSATSGTPSVNISPTQANITVSSGNKNPLSISRTFTFETSQNSNIILNAGTTDNIDYINRRTGNPLSSGNSASLATFRIQDGGGVADADNASTTLTGLSILLSNTGAGMVRRIALFDGGTIIAGTQQDVSGTTVTWTGLSLVATDATGFKDFTVRATFLSLVTDNAIVDVTIQSATAPATGSRFAAGNAGGASSTTEASVDANKIEVGPNALSLVFVANPPNTAKDTNFPLRVEARDAQSNVDLDYARTVTLTASGGPGTLSVQVGESLTPTLASGFYQWNTLRINQSGTYSLLASDNPHDDDFSDATGTVIITSSSSAITPGTTTPATICYGNTIAGATPTAYFPLSSITVLETDVAGMSGTSGSYTFSISLPSGFVFDQTVTTGLSSSVNPGPGPDITIPGGPHYSYPSSNTVQFSFTLNGTAHINNLVIGGLRVGYTHPGTASPAPVGPLTITRAGGSATIAGVTPGVVLGTLNASQQNPAVDFTVTATVGNIDPATTSFNVSSPAVNLIGTGTPVGAFSGSGVTPGPFRFNPSTLAQGIYDITYVQTAASGCQSVAVKPFTVFDSGIGGLLGAYCTNAGVSNDLTVSGTFINNIFGAGWSFDHFTYYDPTLYSFNVPFSADATIGATYTNNGQTFTVVSTILGTAGAGSKAFLCTGTGSPLGSGSLTRTSGTGDVIITYSYYNIGDFRPITSPANNKFDPALPAYQSIYQYFGGQIPIGFAVCGGTSDYPCGYSTYGTFSTYQWVTVNQAPVVSFTMPSDIYAYCQDNAPITLIGSPPNGPDENIDEFSAGAQVTSINSAMVGPDRVWTFSPNAVTGVNTTTSVSVPILYSYRDPATNCVNTFTRSVMVHHRPATVLATEITRVQPGTTPATGTLIQLCEGVTDPFSFTAASSTPGYNFKWYADPLPLSATTLKTTGATFDPPVVTTIPGPRTFYVTQEKNQCESINPLSVTVNVVAAPLAPVPNNANSIRQYCVDGTIDPSHFGVPGTNLRWYNALGAQIVSITDPTLPTPAELSINTDTDTVYTFYVSQTTTPALNSCEGPRTTFTVTIKALPIVQLAALAPADANKICSTKGDVTFFAVDNADNGNAALDGDWSGVGLTGAGVLNPFPSLGQVLLDPSGLNSGVYTLEYDYENSAGCSNSGSLSITILPKITPSITVGNVCDGSPAIIINNSSISDATPPSTITTVGWDFGDGTPFTSGAIGATISTSTTTGTYGSPRHIYPNVGTFQISGTMITSDGCPYDLPQQPVNISALPVANFTSTNVCVDSPTTFTASASVPIQTYYWNFAKNGVLNPGTASGPTTGASFIYTLPGRDTARLVVETIALCRDTVEKPIYIVPNFAAITTASAYTQDFATNDGWVAGGKNSSWELGTPDGPVFQGDATVDGTGRAWDTNLDGNNNVNESSWVLSGCFDFSGSAKPVISLDIWSDNPSRVDGAVLQYNVSGNIEDAVPLSPDPDGDWIVVGTVGSGQNWYDDQGIANSPGNQTITSAGWTGDAVSTNGKYSQWRKAIFRLDPLIGETRKVVFRIAFASAQARGDGFAFDNIFVGERNRTVLLENFTNSTVADVDEHNDYYKDFGNASELVKIQYHTPFPGVDPVNDLNEQMHNSRSAFYGITESPTARLDGGSNNGDISDWLTPMYDNRVLNPAAIELSAVTSPATDGVSLDVRIENKTSQDIDLTNIHLFAVVVDSVVTGTLLGTSGNSEFAYVAKEMLPSAAGLTLPAEISPGLAGVINTSIPWTKRTGNKIVIFLQSITGNNKNVLQAYLLKPLVLPPVVITDTEDPEYAKHISLFPNPANNEVNITLPSAVSKPTPVALSDAYGRVVYQAEFKAGEQTIKVPTSAFANGIYMMQILTPQGNKVLRKVMVKH